MENCMENAKALKEGIVKTGRFEILSKDVGVPLVAFALKDSSKHNVFEIAESLRRFGWIIPAYTMPRDAEHIAVLRVVIREDFSRSLVERLVSDFEKVMTDMDSLPSRSVAHITSEVDNSNMAGQGDGVVIKKSAREEEITRHWRRIVDGKKASKVC